MLNIGDVLGGTYKIIDLLGRGGWGSVYLAEHLKVGNRWAVKEINVDRGADLNLLAEPEILKKLNHQSLPRIIDMIRKENMLYLVEDYFAGRRLSELILSREVCSEENLIDWAKQLCDILIYLHRLQPNPIIYRDLKPSNIIIDQGSKVRLIDFGIAREQNRGQSGDTTFSGTQGYAAPEQFALGGRSDERSDIYGFGATLYHAATGISPNRPPYRMLPIRQVDKFFSAGFERIIEKCVQRDPNLRYQRVEDILQDLVSLRQETWRSGFVGLLGTVKHSLGIGGPRTPPAKGQLLGTVVIAVGSTARGAGATHTSIALASYLARQKFRTAVVELNETPVLYTLEDENSAKGPLKGSFYLRGIMFYKRSLNISANRMGEVLRAGHHYIVLDLGQLVTFNEEGKLKRSLWYDEMHRADLQILVSGAAPWQLKDLLPFTRDDDTKEWRILFKLADSTLMNELKSELALQVFADVFSPDPFRAYPEQERVFTRLLKEVIPKSG